MRKGNGKLITKRWPCASLLNLPSATLYFARVVTPSPYSASDFSFGCPSSVYAPACLFWLSIRLSVCLFIYLSACTPISLCRIQEFFVTMGTLEGARLTENSYTDKHNISRKTRFQLDNAHFKCIDIIWYFCTAIDGNIM